MSRIPTPPDYFSNRPTLLDRRRQLEDTSEVDIQRLKAMATSLVDYKTLILDNLDSREPFEPNKGQFAVFEDRGSYSNPRMFNDMRIQDGASSAGFPIPPTGTFQYFAYTERDSNGEYVDPDGWLECNGQTKMAFVGTQAATRLSTKYTKLYEILVSWGLSLVQNNIVIPGLGKGLQFSVPEVAGYFIRCYNPSSQGPDANRVVTKTNLNIPALQIFNDQSPNLKEHYHEGTNLVRYDGLRRTSSNLYKGTSDNSIYDYGNSSYSTYQFKYDVSDNIYPKNRNWLYQTNLHTYGAANEGGTDLSGRSYPFVTSYSSTSFELWRPEFSGSGGYPSNVFGPKSESSALRIGYDKRYSSTQEPHVDQVLRRYDESNNRYSAYVKHVHANIETVQFEGSAEVGPVLDAGENKDTSYNSYTSYIGYNKVYPNQKNETEGYDFYYAQEEYDNTQTFTRWGTRQQCINNPFGGSYCINIPYPIYSSVTMYYARFFKHRRIYDMFDQIIKETDQGATGLYNTGYTGGTPTQTAGHHNHSFKQVNNYGDGDTRPDNIALKLYIKY